MSEQIYNIQVARQIYDKPGKNALSGYSPEFRKGITEQLRQRVLPLLVVDLPGRLNITYFFGHVQNSRYLALDALACKLECLETSPLG